MTIDDAHRVIELLQSKCSRLEKENAALRLRVELDYSVNADLFNSMNDVIDTIQRATKRTQNRIEGGS